MVVICLLMPILFNTTKTYAIKNAGQVVSLHLTMIDLVLPLPFKIAFPYNSFNLILVIEKIALVIMKYSNLKCFGTKFKRFNYNKNPYLQFPGLMQTGYIN